MFQCKFYKTHGVADPKLFHNPLPVCGDRLVTYEEFLGYCLIVFPLDDHGQDLLFTLRQLLLEQKPVFHHLFLFGHHSLFLSVKIRCKPQAFGQIGLACKHRIDALQDFQRVVGF